MSKILMAGGRKSKDKSEKPKKKTDKSASKKEKRSILREMSKGEVVLPLTSRSLCHEHNFLPRIAAYAVTG
eukprot:m.30883 g.30883  ORF g.30883 m.30883 type:complete len:71 (-) comp6853_c0_seq1:951-1163(-)